MAKRSFRRPPPNRNLRKVYVIATEGKCTEPLYFQCFQGNPRTPSTVSECERELTRLLGKPYDKSNYDPHRLLPKVDHAIAHAQRLHTDDAEPWPPSVGTQVYKLVAHLIASPTPATSP
jgi:hypothetical protein